jgi:hypothetical protein
MLSNHKIKTILKEFLVKKYKEKTLKLKLIIMF